jgi:hypothetical protein
MFLYQRFNRRIHAKAFPESIEKPAGTNFTGTQKLETLCALSRVGRSLREDRRKAFYEALDALEVDFFA